jgi:hypothetical protein
MTNGSPFPAILSYQVSRPRVFAVTSELGSRNSLCSRDQSAYAAPGRAPQNPMRLETGFDAASTSPAFGHSPERRPKTSALFGELTTRKGQHNSEHQRSEAGRIVAAAFDACISSRHDSRAAPRHPSASGAPEQLHSYRPPHGVSSNSLYRSWFAARQVAVLTLIQPRVAPER